MYIYIILMLINLLFLSAKNISVRFKDIKISIDKIFLIVMIVLLGVVMGCRKTSVGIDSRLYERIYIKISESSSLIFAVKTSSFFGPGYILLCWLLHFISTSPRMYIVFSTFVMSVLLYKFARRQANGLLLLFYWQASYLFAFSLNGNRQVFSTLLLTEGISRINENNKDVLGIIIIACGLLIHPVSISILSLYIISKMIANNRKYVNTMILSVALAIGTNFGMTFLISVIVKILPEYAKYVNGTHKLNFFDNVGGGRIIIFYIFLFTIMIIFCVCSDKGPKENVLEKCFCFSIVFVLTLGIINPQNTSIFRIIMFILPQGIAIISNLNQKMKDIDGILMQVTICTIMFMYAVFSLLENESGVVPYELFI